MLCAVLAVGLCAGGSLPGTAADDKADKKSNLKKSNAGVKPSESAQAVDDLAMAESLIQYGRRTKSAEALITAAQVLARIQPEEVKEKPKQEKEADAKAEERPAKRQKPDNSPKALVAEARKMSRAAHIAALADAAERALEEAPRRAEGGPKRDSDTLANGFNVVYTITFRGQEEARAVVVGDGTSRLDMYVYDENDNLLRAAEGAGDKCVCTWVPAWTGKFKIKIVNRGPVANSYAFATN